MIEEVHKSNPAKAQMELIAVPLTCRRVTMNGRRREKWKRERGNM
jgi:hypothetical protein